MDKTNYTTTWFVTTTTSNNTAVIPSSANDGQDKNEKHLIYGLKALADFLHQSVTSAWRVKKNPKYKSAFMQKGRCIITDTNKLMELMRLDQDMSTDESTYYYNSSY